MIGSVEYISLLIIPLSILFTVIYGAIKKVRAAHPRLGQHLSNSIRTGNFCVYSPEAPTSWEL